MNASAKVLPLWRDPLPIANAVTISLKHTFVWFYPQIVQQASDKKAVKADSINLNSGAFQENTLYFPFSGKLF
jgi:hypothetical protein